MDFSSMYYTDLAAAYTRGTAMQQQPATQPLVLRPLLLTKPMEELTAEETEEILTAGKAAGLKLYRFKNTHDTLPRVKMVLSFLKSIEMDTLLDIGSGRGVFLWPCLQAFPQLAVTGLDILPHRVQMLRTVRAGGWAKLDAMVGDICSAPIGDKRYDVVTLLEVLEHIPDPFSAVCAAMRIARKYVVVSVPSKPDTNPEHIHLLTKDILTDFFNRAGCTRLHFSGVTGHLLMVAVLEEAV